MEKNYTGLKVLDFTRVLAGPYLTMLLADNGAEVIKIEKPVTGADERSLAPIVKCADGKQQSGYFMMLNRGKKSVTLDLKDSAAKEIIYKLMSWADVLCENFAPGVMERLGFGYEKAKAINPALVYCSISTFGQEGPLANRPGYDIIAQGMSGLMWLTGEPGKTPMRSGTSICDVNAASHAFGAIGAALYYREKTGKGQYIDISLRDCMSAILETGIVRYTISHGEDKPDRSGAHHATMTPYGVYRAGEDAYITIAAINDRHWDTLCRLMGKETWGAQEKFQGSANRGKNKEEVISVIEAWLQSFGDKNEALKTLNDNKVPAGDVYTIEELLNEKQYRMRDNIVTVNDPVFGTIDLPATPMIFSETTVNNPTPPPELGANTEEVLRDILHLPEKEIKNFI